MNHRRQLDQAFKKYSGRFTILLFDPQVRLHFAIPIKVDGRYGIPHWGEKKQALEITQHPDFIVAWEGYESMVVPYEALRDFEDYHLRAHWHFNGGAVQFFGPSVAMDWVARLTVPNGFPVDPDTGLMLDWDSLPLPHVEHQNGLIVVSSFDFDPNDPEFYAEVPASLRNS